MIKYKSCKAESRGKDWGVMIEETEPVNLQGIELGAILRIADSLEKMEKPFLGMISKLKYQKEYSAKLKKANAGLRRYITRLKNQAVDKG